MYGTTYRIELFVSPDSAFQVVNSYCGAEGTWNEPELGLSRRALSRFAQ